MYHITGLILGLCPANERRRYFVTTSLLVGRKHKISPTLYNECTPFYGVWFVLIGFSIVNEFITHTYLGHFTGTGAIEYDPERYGSTDYYHYKTWQSAHHVHVLWSVLGSAFETYLTAIQVLRSITHEIWILLYLVIIRVGLCILSRRVVIVPADEVGWGPCVGQRPFVRCNDGFRALSPKDLVRFISNPACMLIGWLFRNGSILGPVAKSLAPWRAKN